MALSRGQFGDATLKVLKEKCLVVFWLVSRMKFKYFQKNTRLSQKQLIETVIGAALWYLPTNDSLWNGKLSMKAIQTLRTSSQRVSLTKDHAIPRKMAARELLKLARKSKLSANEIEKKYLKKYGRFFYVLPGENRKIMPYQRNLQFKSAFCKAGIELVNLELSELKSLRKNAAKRFRERR